jgi:hypothetical protein
VHFLVLLHKLKYKFPSLLYLIIKHRFIYIFIYYEYTIPCYKYVSSVLRLNATTADFCAMTFIDIKTEVKLGTAYKKVTNRERGFIFILFYVVLTMEYDLLTRRLFGTFPSYVLKCNARCSSLYTSVPVLRFASSQTTVLA